MSDEKNPTYLFSITDVELLVMIANEQIDPVALAKKELANRGLDIDGNWVGFNRTKNQ